jgi:TM2 domain-containing membrane protein YozV
VNRMAVAARIYELDWGGALGELDGAVAPGDGPRDSLRAQIEGIAETRNKSPVLGGVLSIVPGLGHLYAGRPGDGLRSLLVNGTFTSLAVLSYREDMPVLGSVFAVIEAFAYASNIYGGVNAVQQENARRLFEARDALLKEIPVPPLDVITVRGELPFR